MKRDNSHSDKEISEARSRNVKTEKQRGLRDRVESLMYGWNEIVVKLNFWCE